MYRFLATFALLLVFTSFTYEQIVSTVIPGTTRTITNCKVVCSNPAALISNSPSSPNCPAPQLNCSHNIIKSICAFDSTTTSCKWECPVTSISNSDSGTATAGPNCTCISNCLADTNCFLWDQATKMAFSSQCYEWQSKQICPGIPDWCPVNDVCQYNGTQAFDTCKASAVQSGAVTTAESLCPCVEKFFASWLELNETSTTCSSASSLVYCSLPWSNACKSSTYQNFHKFCGLASGPHGPAPSPLSQIQALATDVASDNVQNSNEGKAAGITAVELFTETVRQGGSGAATFDATVLFNRTNNETVICIIVVKYVSQLLSGSVTCRVRNTTSVVTKKRSVLSSALESDLEISVANNSTNSPEMSTNPPTMTMTPSGAPTMTMTPSGAPTMTMTPTKSPSMATSAPGSGATGGYAVNLGVTFVVVTLLGLFV